MKVHIKDIYLYRPRAFSFFFYLVSVSFDWEQAMQSDEPELIVAETAEDEYV